MLDKLFSMIKGVKLDPNPKFDSILADIEQYVKETHRYYWSNSRLSLKKCEAYDKLKNLPAVDKNEALLYLARRCNVLKSGVKKDDYGGEAYKICSINCNLLDSFMRTRFDFGEDFSFWSLFDALYYLNGDRLRGVELHNRPFGAFCMLVEKHTKRRGLSEALKADIQRILDVDSVAKYLKTNVQKPYYGPDAGKAVKKLTSLIMIDGEPSAVPPYELGSGRFGSIVKHDLSEISSEQLPDWYALFHHFDTASSGKPSKKFSDTANTLVDAIGINQFKSHACTWLQKAAELNVEIEEYTSTFSGREYTYNKHEFIEEYSYTFLKGLLWTMSRFYDKASLQAIATLAEKCFQKIPGIGPAAAGVGNACIYTLANSKGLGGISHLSRLKLRIRQNNTQKLIQKYIDEQAQKQGIKPTQIEEIAAYDYGLENGEKTIEFEDYQLILRLTGVGSTELQWIKPDGTTQKTVPAFVKAKDSYKKKLADMRDLAKQVKQASTAQRDRIDRLYVEDMSWSREDFEKYYLNHGLICQLALKLIWCLNDRPVLYVDGAWQDEQGKSVPINEQTTIRLWHPLESEAQTVLAWRERLESLKIRQPLKQAYREIYLLTDAEINTRIYSNRMAAHILKQHQFNALTALRGWKYSLLGAYDDGRNGAIASKPIPTLGLTAQYWIDEIVNEDSFNEAGIWYYVATDQVRFCDQSDNPVPMIDIPKLVFSEIMRDVDLFVGVASVGNDPQWQDGGPEGRQDYRDYWQSYSFGDLTEVAKTRKAVLERLIPRLKIRDVASIDGKFVIVKGKRHTYKIHIGSGNILIAPNDRYLCIVPGRGKDKKVEQVFLPFEGDNGLSIVLSKAFLLADDDKINDSTILSQL